MWIISALFYLGILVAIINKVLDKKAERFVIEHSYAFSELRKLNNTFIFQDVPNLNLKRNYDNANHYNEISPSDLLTYELLSIEKSIEQAVSIADKNKQLYNEYTDKLLQINRFGIFDRHRFIAVFHKKISKSETNIFKKFIKKPVTEFTISVTICRTTIEGRRLEEKTDSFDVRDIDILLKRLKNRKGSFYLDQEIWNSICRVERGKVSNKIRFAVYKRDENRCRRCGSTNQIEIDHIFPISKGGKTTLDNLQTLCHRCNSLKSNIIESNANIPSDVFYDRTRRCQICNAPMTLRNGAYGKFYGCSNFPKCKFTMRIDDETNAD